MLLLSLAMGLGGCVRTSPGTSEDKKSPSVVYLAARVHTLDASQPVADALWVRDGRVVRAGPRKEILAEAGPLATVDDLHAAIVVPGLSDAHVHLASLGDTLTSVDLSGTATLEALYAKLQQAAQTSRRGDWIVGRRWNDTEWTDNARQLPTRARLDALFPHVPVYLTRVDGHAAWVNGEALRRAGITSRSPDPEGGQIVRDSAGEPTGVLIDNAMDLVASRLPPLSDEERVRRLEAALAHCVSVGLTSVHDAGMDLETFTLLQQWDLAGRLPLRIYAMAYGQGPDAEAFLGRGLYKGRMLEMRAVKLLADGALGSRGAALFEPYTDEPSKTGLLLLHPQELTERARRFMEAGFQVAVHAIGDRANALALDTLGFLAEATKTKHLRHRLEHAQVMRLNDIQRAKELGLVASMQPTHATSDMPWALARLGPDRLAGAYAWKSFLEAGVPLALGSDFPVENPSPLLGLYAARTRQDANGLPEGGWYPKQRLSGEEALRGFTVGAAYAAHAEETRGTLAPGKTADFTVLSVDPVDGPPQALLGASVLRTVLEGKETYRALKPSASASAR